MYEYAGWASVRTFILPHISRTIRSAPTLWHDYYCYAGQGVRVGSAVAETRRGPAINNNSY